MERDYDYIQEILKQYGWDDIMYTELPEEFEETAFYSNRMTDEEYADAMDQWLSITSRGEELYEGEDSIHTKKWDRCVQHVKDQGKSEESAYRICSSSIKDAGVKKSHQRKRGKQYYANRRKSETNEATGAASSGQFSGPFMGPIKRTIKEALESAYKDGPMVTNEMLEKELDEATSTTSVGANSPTGSFGYEIPGVWAKDLKNMRFNKKTAWPGGSFVSVKEKCRKFPYCNQGDIRALNFSNPKVSRNSQLSEIKLNKSVKNSPIRNFILSKLNEDKKEYRGGKWRDSDWLVTEIMQVLQNNVSSSYTLMEYHKKFPQENLIEFLKKDFPVEFARATKLLGNFNGDLKENHDIYNKTKIMGTANKIKELEKILFKNYLTEDKITEARHETSTGYWVKREYDNNGNLIHYKNSDGNIMDNTNNNLNEARLNKNIKIIGNYPNGKWKKYEYDDNGNKVYFENSYGKWEKYEYDENGNEIYYENSDGFWVKSEYDNNGKLVYQENSYGKWEKYEYDNNGNLIYIEDSDGSWIKREYDNNGNLIYKEDSTGYWVKREYDNNGNLIHYETSTGYWEKREYDNNGKMVYYENSDGNIMDNTNNNLNEARLKKRLKNIEIKGDYPNGEWKRSEYDDNGNEIYYTKSWFNGPNHKRSRKIFDKYHKNYGSMRIRTRRSAPVSDEELGEVVNDELMRMYENEKRKNMKEAKEPGIIEYQKAHKKSGENNRASNKASMEKAAGLNKMLNKTEDEKLSAIGKGFPKYANFDKKNFQKQAEEIDTLRGGGLEDIQFDLEPSEDYKKRAEEAITGSARMGNDPNYANAMRDFDGEKGDLGKRIIKKAKNKNEMENKADEQKPLSMDVQLPPKGKKFVATEGKQKIKDITIVSKEPIYYYKDIEKVLTENCKKDGQKTVVLDSKGTRFDVIWEGHNYYVESETNEILKESEIEYMKKIMEYKVGNYNKKPKSMKKLK